MRILVVGLVMGCLSCSAAHMAPPVLDPFREACNPEAVNHTNPPILAGKGNSVEWFQCDRATQKWVALQASYHVFDKGKCNPTRQFLDAGWFGTATEYGKAKLHDRKGEKKQVSKVKLTSDEYTLKIEFEKPDNNSFNPNEIELCMKGGPCCVLVPSADQTLQGKIPYEFEQFDDQKIEYGVFGKGQVPLEFATCKAIGCQEY